MGTDLGPWEPLSPYAVGELLRGFHTPWWFAGGYAIEMFVGRAFRPHDDIDVLLLRQDQAVIHHALAGWDIQAADPPGTLRPWHSSERLPAHVHDIWCRERPDAPWRLQFMLDEADGDEWRSRRDPRITRPLWAVGGMADDGSPYLTPEIQLFYKAKGRRPKDEQDFAAARPLLDDDQREWLDHALALTAPGHPWRRALTRTDLGSDLPGRDG